MQNFVINDNNDFTEVLWNLRSSKDDQIILSLQNNVNHHFAIRLFHEKFIWIKSNSESDKKDYLIDAAFTSSFDDKLVQSEYFDFAGQSTSTYLFSNLNFKAVITADADLAEINEVLFLIFSNLSNTTFVDCVFINDTDKIFKVEAWYETVVEFLNCKFIGNFKFETFENAVILK